MEFLRNVFSHRIWIITDLLRGLFLFLDGVLYNLIQPLYAAALSLADIRGALQQDALVEMISKKLYVFLGLFMFFKLAFSIISMIANPDVINDKQKGLGKIFTTSIITLILVTTMPLIFKMAYGLQDTLINGGYLMGIFGETPGGRSANGSEGAALAKSVFGLFIEVNPEASSEASSAYEKFIHSEGGVDIGILNEKDAMTKHTNSRYHISYMMLLSTIVGAMMVISFIKIAIEIAFRSLKLLVLEVISPIAVISYVDPASSTKGIFAKWMSLTLKTYFSLFIRLGTLYLIMAMLSGIDVNQFGEGLGTLSSILLILALLAFIQIAPKILEELFGYKPGEDGKAIKGIVGGALGFGVGAATGALGVASQLGGFVGDKLTGDKPPGNIRKFFNKAKDVGGATIGGVSDVVRSGTEGFKSGAKSGPMSARTTPKDVNYKQAKQQKEKANAERWKKQEEFDASLKQGRKYLDMQTEFKNEYMYNPSNYTGDPNYTSLYNAATQPNPSKDDKDKFEKYAESSAIKKFNENTFSKPIAEKKNSIINLEEDIAINTRTKIVSQANLDSVISRGFAPGTTEYDTAISDLMNVNSLIAKDTETLEKTKGGLDALLKSPQYAKDAKIDQGIKLAKNIGKK